MITAVALKLLQLFVEGQESSSLNDLILSCFFNIYVLDFLCNSNLKQIKKALLKCVSETLHLKSQNSHNLEVLTNELLMRLEDPTKVLPLLSKMQKAIDFQTNQPPTQIEALFISKSSKLLQLFRTVMEGMQILIT
jgi:hypothetical protein